MRRTLAALSLGLALTAPTDAGQFIARRPVACGPYVAFDAANPTAAGYSLVFADDFTSASTIDLANSKAAGYKWYPSNFFSGYVTPSSEISVSGGVLTISPSAQSGNYNLATAALNAAGTASVGQAWGGGFYVEARLRFSGTINTANGWPSFWGLALEHGMHNVSQADQWPGQPPGFLRYIETDIFEYDLGYGLTTNYGAAFHDWYGDPTGTCAYGYRAGQGGICEISNTGSSGSTYSTNVAGIKGGGAINFSQWHTYGQLYVPASANGGSGYMKNFFDGLVAGADPGNANDAMVGWSSAVTPTPATLSGSSAAFGVVDQQRIYFILGAGAGQSMDVDYVRVWQIPGCAR